MSKVMVFTVSILLLGSLALAEKPLNHTRTTEEVTLTESSRSAEQGDQRTATTVEQEPGETPVPLEISHQRNQQEQDDFAVPWKTINGGGGRATDGVNHVAVSIGQVCIGRAAAPDLNAGIGFWHGIGSAGCDCGLAGDVDCDEVTTPYDVIVMVNFVYKSYDDRCNRATCPYDVGDFDCDTYVTPTDVILLVNHVYKSQPASTLCDGCAVQK